MQNSLTTAAGHSKPIKHPYHHSQSPVNRTGRQTVLKKTQVRYFLQDGSISALLLVMISDQSFGVFFLFQSEKEQTGVKKWKTLQPSPFLRQKLNGKNTGTA